MELLYYALPNIHKKVQVLIVIIFLVSSICNDT